jgi:hypothetical protein
MKEMKMKAASMKIQRESVKKAENEANENGAMWQ